MFSTKRIIATLILVSVASGLLTNCTQESKIKDADRRQREAKAQLAKAESLQKNYKSKLADATAQAVENKKISSDLNAQVAAWTSKQTDREQALAKMQELLTSEEMTLKSLREQKVSVDAYIASERARIKTESEVLESAKKNSKIELDKVTAQIAKLKSDADSDIKSKNEAADAAIKAKQTAADTDIATKVKALEARQTELTAQIAKADARDQELKDKSQLLDDQEAIQFKSQEELDKLQLAINERKAQLESSIASTREFFMKNAIGDVFEKINNNERMVFLVRVVGFGSAKNLKYVRDQVQALSDAKSKYKGLATLADLDAEGDVEIRTQQNLPPLSITAKDTFLIDVEANKLRATRDAIEAALTAKNSKENESRNYNSLWLVVRPVNKVRAGMKMIVSGSTDKYFDGRSNQDVAVFKNIRSDSQQVIGISDLDLTKPGAYMFENSKSAKSCESLSIDCLEALVKENLLEANQSLEITDASGSKTTVETYRKLLEFLISGSINQARNDMKDKTVLGLKYDKFDNSQWTFDKDALMDKYGFADRAPVIDDISLQYTVSMIESISPITNDMDTYLFMYSGLVGKNQMYDLTERKRGEIAIPLPIAKYKESHSGLKDLTLKDFKVKTQLPVKPAELSKIESIGYWSRTSEQQAKYTELSESYTTALAQAEEAIKTEKQLEFEERTFYNAGILSLMKEKLQAK